MDTGRTFASLAIIDGTSAIPMAGRVGFLATIEPGEQSCERHHVRMLGS